MGAAADARDRSQGYMAGRRFGRYEVLTQLAAGGMASVYVARAVGVAGFERLVAIKVLHPHLAHEDEFITMFLDEARLAARIRHPNVVATLDISDTEGDGYFIVMDYVEGDHLGAILQRAAKAGRRLSPSIVCRILVDALTGLAAAHQLTDERGEPLLLVHRDISPHNILVGVDGSARLTDFGVAKAEVRLSSTREGQFKGKLAYMAPEQASDGVADQRSDLFSMGILLWESLTGRRLFRGTNNAETLNKILKEPIPDPSSLVPRLAPFDEVVAGALARAPHERFQTADEFAEALEHAAKRVQGLATARAVAEAVRTHAAEKLTEEQKRLRDAINYLGRTDIGSTPAPRPEGSAYSSPSHRSAAPPAAEGDTVAARPRAQAQAHAAARPRRRRPWVVLAAVTVVIGGAIAAGWLLGLQESAGEQAAEPTGGGKAAAELPSTSAQPPDDEAAARPEAESEPGRGGGAPDQPVSQEPAAPPQPPGAPTEREGANETEAGAEVAQEEQKSRTRPSRARRRARRRAARSHDSPPSDVSGTQEPEDDEGDDDDLLLNPYRR